MTACGLVRAGGQKCLAQQSQHVLKVLLHPEPQAFTFDIVAGESSDQDAVFRGALVTSKQLSSSLEIDVPTASMCVHSILAPRRDTSCGDCACAPLHELFRLVRTAHERQCMSGALTMQTLDGVRSGGAADRGELHVRIQLVHLCLRPGLPRHYHRSNHPTRCPPFSLGIAVLASRWYHSSSVPCVSCALADLPDMVSGCWLPTWVSWCADGERKDVHDAGTWRGGVRGCAR